MGNNYLKKNYYKAMCQSVILISMARDDINEKII